MLRIIGGRQNGKTLSIIAYAVSIGAEYEVQNPMKNDAPVIRLSISQEEN